MKTFFKAVTEDGLPKFKWGNLSVQKTLKELASKHASASNLPFNQHLVYEDVVKKGTKVFYNYEWVC